MPETKQEDQGAKLRAQSMKEFEERTKGKPTPTQEENDRAKMGEHVVDKEPDGSKEEPAFGSPHPAQAPKGSKSEPLKTSDYPTRQSTAKQS